MAGVLYGPHRATLALTDSILLFFMTCMVPFTVMALKKTRKKEGEGHTSFPARLILAIILSGLCIMLAIGTKLNGALSGILFVASMAFALLFAKKRLHPDTGSFSIVPVLAVALGTIMFAGVLFVAFNPFLYANPVGKMASVLAVYDDWMLKQAIEPGPPLWSFVQKITAAGFFNFTLAQEPFLKSDFPLLFILFWIGLGLLARSTIQSVRNRSLSLWNIVLLVWIIVYGIGITCWIPVACDRYFLPLAPFIALASGIGVSVIIKTILRHTYYRWLKPVRAFLNYEELYWVAGSLIVSLILWYGIMDRSLLPPQVFSSYGKAERLESIYKQTNRNLSSHPLRAIYAADYRMICHHPSGALPLYETGLGLLKNRVQGKMEKTMTALAGYSLAEAYFVSGRYEDAQIVFAAHLRGLQELANSLRSSDEKVDREFNAMIIERKGIYQMIRQKSGK